MSPEALNPKGLRVKDRVWVILGALDTYVVMEISTVNVWGKYQT